MMVHEVFPVSYSTTWQKKIKKALYLKLKNTEDENFSIIRQKLSEYSGDIPVIIYLTDTNKKLEAPRNLWIREENALISSLFDILGEKNVKLVK